MRSDFANRSARKPSNARKSSPKKTNKRGQRPQRTLFHGPSFSGGLLMGGVLVLAGAYLPEWLPKLFPNSAAVGTNVAQDSTAAPTPRLRFKFDDLLRNNEVSADPSVYVGSNNVAARRETGDTVPTDATEYLLQAASFRSPDEADALRARLLLLDLPAATDSVALTNGRWYRVTVGPFASKTAAQRAMTRLRERDMSPMWIKRKAA